MEIIDLEMIPGGPKKTCHASQYDNGRVIRFNLKENGQPFALSGTETVQAIIRKPDGSETTLDIANTSSTYVDLITEEDTCDLAGVNHCEMKVTEDGEDLGSGNFDMKVEEDAYGAGDVSVGTASGPIASFETNIKDDLIECVCEINPVQDLHGYDHPWPAGGGNNLLKLNDGTYSINGVTIVIENGKITANGTATSGGGRTTKLSDNFILKAGTYYINGYFLTSGIYPFINNASNNQPINTGDTMTFIIEEDTEVYFGINQTNGQTYTNATGSPMINAGNTSMPWEPYENICPISGFTEMDIIRSGVNLWDEEWEVGGIDVSTGELIPLTDRIRTKNMIPVKGGTSYYFDRANFAGNIFEYDANGNFIQLVGSPTSFTTTTNTRFLRFYMASAYGTTYNNDISINYPSTDTAYHPAEIIEKNIQLGQTVYRARINITTGRGIIDMVAVDLGSLSYTKTTASGYTVFWANITGKAQNTHSLCESYKNSNNGRDTLLDNEYGTYNLASLKNTIAIRDDAKASLSEADFKTAMAGILFTYELATPVEIDLTPEQIETLVGQKNNVYHNANGNTAVKFYTRA